MDTYFVYPVLMNYLTFSNMRVGITGASGSEETRISIANQDPEILYLALDILSNVNPCSIFQDYINSGLVRREASRIMYNDGFRIVVWPQYPDRLYIMGRILWDRVR